MNTNLLMFIFLLFVSYIILLSCQFIYRTDNSDESSDHPEGSVYKLSVNVNGSCQNPSWPPDGNFIIFTNFTGGYNEGQANLMMYNLVTKALKPLVWDGSDNINVPGLSWNPVTRYITFASARDPHDEIYIIPDTGKTGDEIQITSRSKFMDYDPTFSPDGQWVVFESHPLDVEGQGVIMKHRLDQSVQHVALTDAGRGMRSMPPFHRTGNG